MKASEKYPPVVVVDEDDNEIGSAMLDDIWQNGLYHRTVAIFVFDDLGRVLLQLRGQNVKVYPYYWGEAAGGHVDQGQTYDHAAANEVAEEIGLFNIELTTMGKHYFNATDGNLKINQFECVYKIQIPSDTKLKAEPSEVSKLQWFTPAELKIRITQSHDKFTPGLLYNLDNYFPEF